MALETGNYINNLVPANPPAGDPVSQGDDHLRLIKKVVQQSFPSVDQTVNAIHTKATAPATGLTEGLIWIDTSAGAGNHLIKVYDGATFLTLPFSVEAAKTVDVDGGAIDGTTIGVTTPASVKGTTVEGTTSLKLATGATVTGVDNATLATGSATLLATQGAIKTYVDAQVTAADLDYTDNADTGGLTVDLDTQTFKIAGNTGITTAGVGQILTVSGVAATTSAQGVASFDSDHFDVTAGAVSIKADGIDDTLIDFGTGANQVSTADVPEQTNLYYTDVRADARIAAADIGDLNNVNTAGLADNDILKYDSATSSFVAEPDRIANHLTTKGDLLGFSTVETRVPVGINGTVLTADSTGTYGVAWTAGGDAVGTAAAMAIALG